MPSGRYKTHKVDLTGWNDKDNTLLWRKAWADFTNNFLERNGSPERIDHRSNAERGIDEIPTVHMGVAACQMEKKGIATEKGELNRNIPVSYTHLDVYKRQKYVLPNLPYLFVGLYATKLGQAWRLSSGMEFADKVLHLMDGFATAFQSAAPSFHPSDLLVE